MGAEWPSIPLSQKGAANGVATLNAEGKVPAGQLAVVFNEGRTWVIAGEVTVQTLPGPVVVPAAGEEVSAFRLDYKIREGTKVKFKLQKAGADLTGFTGLEATTTAAHVTPTAVAVTEGQEITLVVEEVTGTPKGFSATLQLKHVAA